MAASALYTITMGKASSSWGSKIGPVGTTEPAEPISVFESKGFSMLVKYSKEAEYLEALAKHNAPIMHKAIAWSRKALDQVRQ